MKQWPSSIVRHLSLWQCLAMCTLALIGALLYWTSAVSAPVVQTHAPGPNAEYVPGEILVKLTGGTTRSRAAARILSAQDLAAASPVPGLGILKVKVPPGQEIERAQSLERLPGVEYAEPNYIAYALEVPNDPQFDLQWGLTKINAPTAWGRTHGSATVVIAVVDTGISASHEDLYPKALAGYNYVSPASIPVGDIPAGADSDDNGHGTHVAGIAAANTNNLKGGAGLAGNSGLMPVKVLSSSARGTYENVALGIRWAADHGAQIINLSLGGNEDSLTLKEAVDYAYGRGCLLVAASGNSGMNSLLYPAAYLNVMSVGATDASDQRAWFSNYASTLSIVAPGVSTYSTLPYNSYGYESGTSMACSYVSGLAALVWASGPSCSRSEVQQIVQETAVDIGPVGRDDEYGHGRIDAGAAIQQMLSVTVSRREVAFLADDHQRSLPASVEVNMAAQGPCAMPGSVSWTTAISPATTTWATVSPPTGVMPASGQAVLRVTAEQDGLTHGNYRCELIIQAHTGTLTLSTPVTVFLSYVDQVQRRRLFPVFKEFTWN